MKLLVFLVALLPLSLGSDEPEQKEGVPKYHDYSNIHINAKDFFRRLDEAPPKSSSAEKLQKSDPSLGILARMVQPDLRPSSERIKKSRRPPTPQINRRNSYDYEDDFLNREQRFDEEERAIPRYRIKKPRLVYGDDPIASQDEEEYVEVVDIPIPRSRAIRPKYKRIIRPPRSYYEENPQPKPHREDDARQYYEEEPRYQKREVIQRQIPAYEPRTILKDRYPRRLSRGRPKANLFREEVNDEEPSLAKQETTVKSYPQRVPDVIYDDLPPKPYGDLSDVIYSEMPDVYEDKMVPKKAKSKPQLDLYDKEPQHLYEPKLRPREPEREVYDKTNKVPKRSRRPSFRPNYRKEVPRKIYKETDELRYRERETLPTFETFSFKKPHPKKLISETKYKKDPYLTRLPLEPEPKPLKEKREVIPHGGYLDKNGLEFAAETAKIEQGDGDGRVTFQIHGQHGPHSYRFGYDTGKGYNRQFRYEERDAYGEVKGRYGYYDKDGRLQVVNYSAHPKHGFRADVPKH